MLGIYWKDIGTFIKLIRRLERDAANIVESFYTVEKHSQGRATGNIV